MLAPRVWHMQLTHTHNIIIEVGLDFEGLHGPASLTRVGACVRLELHTLFSERVCL
jgi:hypothetical protein